VRGSFWKGRWLDDWSTCEVVVENGFAISLEDGFSRHSGLSMVCRLSFPSVYIESNARVRQESCVLFFKLHPNENLKLEIGIRLRAIESLQQLAGRQDLTQNPLEFEQLGSVGSTKQQSARAETAIGDRRPVNSAGRVTHRQDSYAGNAVSRKEQRLIFADGEKGLCDIFCGRQSGKQKRKQKCRTRLNWGFGNLSLTD
jgi:hypothetical protein